MPTMIGLLITTTLYALLLSLPWGQEWAAAQTWSTVALGIAIVAGWIWMDDPALAERVLRYFSVAGIPMVIRSLILQFLRQRALLQRLMHEDS